MIAGRIAALHKIYCVITAVKKPEFIGDRDAKAANVSIRKMAAKESPYILEILVAKA